MGINVESLFNPYEIGNMIHKFSLLAERWSLYLIFSIELTKILALNY